MEIPKTKQIRLKGQAYKDLQHAVLERDNYTCRQCDKWTEAPPHHVLKVSQGGSDTLDNLVTLCHVCHDKYPNWKKAVVNVSYPAS